MVKRTRFWTNIAMHCRSTRYLEQTIKRGLLLFWAAWLTIVCLTNFFDWLKSIGVMGEEWKFASHNYTLMAETMAIYDAPKFLTTILLLTVTIWQGVAALLFWRALVLTREDNATPYLLAFTLSLPIWATFMLADEILIAYSLQSSHMRIFIAQLVSLLVCERFTGPSGQIEKTG